MNCLPMKTIVATFLCWIALGVASSLSAQSDLNSDSANLGLDFDEQFTMWPEDLKINGTIIASNQLAVSGGVFDYVKRQIESAADDNTVRVLEFDFDVADPVTESLFAVEWPENFEVTRIDSESTPALL